MKKDKSIGVGLLGLGVVGSGVAAVLLNKQSEIAQQIGCPLTLKKILVRSSYKSRAVKVDQHLLTIDHQQILNDPDIGIVVELMGGYNPALDYIEEALRKSKHVVTANKEVMAKHGADLLCLAETQGVSISYEASVGGGIPLIAPLRQYLVANKVSALYAIINGTTNYILTKMSKESVNFQTALKSAQELGYAEANPANDIDGVDAAYKLSIMATLAFQAVVHPDDVYYDGITRLTERDFRYAKELGYAIKLLAIGKEIDDAIEVRVHSTFVPEDFLLAKVDGVYNAVQIEGDLTGKVIFYGEGAGALPTASSVTSDIIAAAYSINLGRQGISKLILPQIKPIKPISDIETCYYLRMSIADQPGIFAQIAQELGTHSISISSVIQKESDATTKTAEIVIMTHPAREQSMQQALDRIQELPVVKEIGNFIRVETLEEDSWAKKRFVLAD